MTNPILVETTRGSRVESFHRGSVAVVDADGATAFSLGDVAIPVYPRSAIKALQALVLVESGAVDRFQLCDEELALACASHGGELAHVAAVARMLAKIGRNPTALRCGAHWPLHQPSLQALACSGDAPSPLHNNCSGKHAGFICAAAAMGVDDGDYIAAHHPVQREVKARIEDLTGAKLEAPAVDGCSAPTWPIALRDLAHAFARFGTGRGLAPARAEAARRLRVACAAKPWFVAGSGRFCTEVMERFGERVFIKTGAEGVFCAALPEHGLGIAIKCDDGAGRAAEVVAATLIARFATVESADCALMERLQRPVLRNWNGVLVGALRPGSALGSIR